jgi:hypothetical protein
MSFQFDHSVNLEHQDYFRSFNVGNIFLARWRVWRGRGVESGWKRGGAGVMAPIRTTGGVFQ